MNIEIKEEQDGSNSIRINSGRYLTLKEGIDEIEILAKEEGRQEIRKMVLEELKKLDEILN